MVEVEAFLGDLARSGLAIPNLGVALAIIAVAYVLARLFRGVVEKVRRKTAVVSPQLYVIEQLGAYAIIVAGLLVGVSTLGLNLSSLSLFGGAVGVGVGLGLQGVVREFVSGIVLIFDRALQIGDFVELPDGVRGEIVEIGPRATRLRTNDDLNVVIPNSKFIQSQVVNWTYNNTSRRMHVPFTVDIESDVALVRDVVIAAAKALPFTLPDDDLHKTQVWLTSFAGQGLCFDLVVWPAPASTKHPRTMHAAYTWAVYEGLRKAGVTGANRQMDVHLRSLFGREEEQAAQLLGLAPAAKPAPGQTDSAPPPNDALRAMFDDASRHEQNRERDEGGRRPRNKAPETAP